MGRIELRDCPFIKHNHAVSIDYRLQPMRDDEDGAVDESARVAESYRTARRPIPCADGALNHGIGVEINVCRGLYSEIQLSPLNS